MRVLHVELFNIPNDLALKLQKINELNSHI